MVQRRFSDFTTLDKALRKECARVAVDSFKPPELPKTITFPSAARNDDRKQQLHVYMDCMCQSLQNAEQENRNPDKHNKNPLQFVLQSAVLSFLEAPDFIVEKIESSSSSSSSTMVSAPPASDGVSSREIALMTSEMDDMKLGLEALTQTKDCLKASNKKLEADLQNSNRELERVRPFENLVELHVTFARDMAVLREKLAAINPPPAGSHIAESAGLASAKSQAEYFKQCFSAIKSIEQECRSLLQDARRSDDEGGVCNVLAQLTLDCIMHRTSQLRHLQDTTGDCARELAAVHHRILNLPLSAATRPVSPPSPAKFDFLKREKAAHAVVKAAQDAAAASPAELTGADVLGALKVLSFEVDALLGELDNSEARCNAIAEVKKTLHTQVVELSSQANELNRQLDGLNGQVVELNRELNSVKDEKMVAEMRAETATQIKKELALQLVRLQDASAVQTSTAAAAAADDNAAKYK